jgi:hypothetical protein
LQRSAFLPVLGELSKGEPGRHENVFQGHVGKFFLEDISKEMSSWKTFPRKIVQRSFMKTLARCPWKTCQRTCLADLS